MGERIGRSTQLDAYFHRLNMHGYFREEAQVKPANNCRSCSLREQTFKSVVDAQEAGFYIYASWLPTEIILK